jgi:hypothetical protein
MAVAFEMDESAFPVVFAAFRGPVDLVPLDAYFARLDGFCREGRTFTLIVDMSRGAVPSPSERKHITSAMAERDVALGRHCLGAAVVITNPLIRGAMTAVLWVHRLPYPHEIVETKEAAEAACARWLSRAPAST